MADASVISLSAGRLRIDPGTTPVLTAAFSLIGAIYFNANTINGDYHVPFQLWNSGTTATYFELYRTPPDDANPNDLYLFYRTAGGGQDVNIADSSVAYGHWIHIAWTQSAALAGNFYAAFEGFAATPTYLITPSRGTIVNASTRIEAWTEKDQATITVATSIRQAHLIAAEAELTEAQVLSQWRQRAPTSTVTAVDNLYLACNDAANVEDDQGSPGTNWTKTGTFAAALGQPSEWGGMPPLLLDSHYRLLRGDFPHLRM